MNVDAIQDAIVHLSAPERQKLAEWFGELQEDERDRQMAEESFLQAAAALGYCFVKERFAYARSANAQVSQ